MLKLAQLRGKTALTNEATILALLVCWALQQQEAASARALLLQASAAVQELICVFRRCASSCNATGRLRAC